MPAVVQKRGELYRVVRSEDGKLIRSNGNKPVDGGGHHDKKRAVAQAAEINLSLKKRDALMGDKPIHLALETIAMNDLPDSSFAIVQPGGHIDDTGRTVPRLLRKLPYRNAQGGLMAPQAHAALAALNGARGGIDATHEEMMAAWHRIVAAIRGDDDSYEPPHMMF